jgi:hypothetical protein
VGQVLVFISNNQVQAFKNKNFKNHVGLIFQSKKYIKNHSSLSFRNPKKGNYEMGVEVRSGDKLGIKPSSLTETHTSTVWFFY